MKKGKEAKGERKKLLKNRKRRPKGVPHPRRPPSPKKHRKSLVCVTQLRPKKIRC